MIVAVSNDCANNRCNIQRQFAVSLRGDIDLISNYKLKLQDDSDQLGRSCRSNFNAFEFPCCTVEAAQLHWPKFRATSRKTCREIWNCILVVANDKAKTASRLAVQMHTRFKLLPLLLLPAKSSRSNATNTYYEIHTFQTNTAVLCTLKISIFSNTFIENFFSKVIVLYLLDCFKSFFGFINVLYH